MIQRATIRKYVRSHDQMDGNVSARPHSGAFLGLSSTVSLDEREADCSADCTDETGPWRMSSPPQSLKETQVLSSEKMYGNMTTQAFQKTPKLLKNTKGR